VTELEIFGSVEAWEADPGTYVVSAHGPLDERMASELRDVLVPLAAADGDLTLDLGDAHGIDEAIVEILGRAAHLAARRGERLRIVTQSASTIGLIRETGLDEVVEMVPPLGREVA
jgi:anti-anti-sigma factor